MESNSALTMKELADYLSISGQMAYNLVHKGEIPAFKVGNANRVMLKDVNAYIEKQKQRYSAFIKDEETLKISDLTFSKGDFSVENLNLTFPSGKILSILGSSGSGKTMLLKAIAGIVPIDSGDILLNGKNLSDIDTHLRKIGYVFEEYALFPTMTGQKNIEFPLRVRKASADKIKKETEKRIKELDIDAQYLETLPEYLPAGIKQLVAIARGKNHELDLFIMDEPMSQLDAAHHVQMRMFLQKFVRDFGKTTIIASNDPEDSLALSDYIAVIDDGKILQVGETHEVYNNPSSLTVMELISRMGVNTIKINVSNNKSNPFGMQMELKDGEYTMAFRPEEVSESDEGIEVEIESKQFLNSNKSLVLGHYNEFEIRAVVGLKDDQTKVKLLPTNYHIF